MTYYIISLWWPKQVYNLFTKTSRSGMFQNSDFVVLSVLFRSGIVIRSLQLSQIWLPNKLLKITKEQLLVSRALGVSEKGWRNIPICRLGTWSTEKLTSWIGFTVSGASGCQTQVFWLLSSPLLAASPCWMRSLQPYVNICKAHCIQSITKNLEPLTALSRIPVHSMLKHQVRF